MRNLLKRLPARTRRILVGFVGWLVLLVGIVMIPYPGPGWVVVVVGLSILATEFERAKRFNDFARAKYDNWQVWITAQPPFIRAIFWCLTAATVIVTLWLLNMYGQLDSWFNLHQQWLSSPLLTRH